MKHIPENEVLYIGIKDMDFTDADENATTTTGVTAIEEVTSALDCAPNGSIAGSSSLPVSISWVSIQPVNSMIELEINAVFSKIFLIFFSFIACSNLTLRENRYGNLCFLNLLLLNFAQYMHILPLYYEINNK
jgi:hypothetical protein